jgi:hypothetical protein
MLRTALLTSLAALGLAGISSAADVRYFPQVRPGYQANYGNFQQAFRGRTYEVEYRTCSHDRWRTYTVTRNHEQAHQIVRMLERRGLQARVDH